MAYVVFIEANSAIAHLQTTEILGSLKRSFQRCTIFSVPNKKMVESFTYLEPERICWWSFTTTQTNQTLPPSEEPITTNQVGTRSQRTPEIIIILNLRGLLLQPCRVASRQEATVFSHLMDGPKVKFMNLVMFGAFTFIFFIITANHQ